MLKTLALHMASLHARVSHTPNEVGSLSDDVRALCDQISRQGMTAAAEYEATLQQKDLEM